jgi:protein involved in polysaccharide export with SLBB domain
VFCGYFFGCALVLAAFGSAAADPRFADPKTWLQGLSNQWNATSPAPTNVPPTNAAPLTSDLRPPTSAPPASGSNTNAFSTMDTLDDKHKLALGDRLSFRIVEDQEDPRETLAPKPPVPVTDSGDVEVPYIGRFPAVGKTCKQLAREIRTELEKKYYYQATVIIALDLVTRSGGRVYLVGQVRASGPVEIPGDEVFTLSKAILRAGGFTEYANQRHVKVTRNGRDAANKTQTFIVNMNEVFEKGKTESDMKLEPGDLIFVPRRLVIF